MAGLVHDGPLRRSGNCRTGSVSGLSECPVLLKAHAAPRQSHGFSSVIFGKHESHQNSSDSEKVLFAHGWDGKLSGRKTKGPAGTGPTIKLFGLTLQTVP
jgi:hypothetical protein